jgi:2'-5' RNA ligase
MAKIAIDVVLLPSDEMMDEAIKLNRESLKTFDEKIILNKENCLPHVSLAMGCIYEKDIPDIDQTLQDIAKQHSFMSLRVIDIQSPITPTDEKASVLEIEKTKRLQLLHEDIMKRLRPYFTYDVTADMLLSAPRQVAQSTLSWIKNYPQKSGFEDFSPHITIGFGRIPKLESPINFTASRLALCHLGNHCTCRKILISIELKSQV